MKIYFFAILALVTSNVFGQGIITTIAGTGSFVHSGDGGLANTAGTPTPSGVVVDRFGNYYFAERFWHRVRKVSMSGTISTVAGTGTSGYSGDNGPATSAMIDNPNWLATDSAGNLYISEVEGSRIRKVNAATGIITTVAGNGIAHEAGDGGLATNASFKHGGSILIDRGQNIFFGTAGNRIRKVEYPTGIISLYAGNDTIAGFAGDGGPATNATLGGVAGLAMDDSGNLFFAEIGNKRIRCIDHATSIINTFAGTGTAIYNGDGRPATATNMQPRALCIDQSNVLFFGEYSGNSRVRKIDRDSQNVYTKAGTGTAGFSGDGGWADTAKIYDVTGMSLDPCSNIYLCDGGNNRIRKITYPYGNQPGITITAQGGNTLCYPMPTTFTAHTTLAGSAPVYQWRVNGTPVGTSAPTYTYTPANGDSIDCILTSNLYCVVNPRDTSSALHMSVFSLTPLSLSLSAPASAVAGDTAVVTASITGTGLGAYTITWYNNGVWLDTTSTTTLRYIKPAGDDTITAVLVSHSRNCYDSVVAAGHVVRANVGVMESGEGKESAGVTLWPNPVTGVLHIGNLSPDGTTLTLYDLLGRELLRSEVAGSAGEVNLPGLVSGVYVVQVCDMGSGVRVVRRVGVE